MKITAIILMILLAIFLFMSTGCGDKATIDGTTYGTYGLINEGGMRNEDVHYRVIIGNVVWSCILVETIIAPIYFLGFSLYEPVGVKDKDKPKGAI